MSLRSSAAAGDALSYRQPVIRSKVWGFEPFWKFVNYDVELSSNSSTSSNGKSPIDDDFYFVAGIGPTADKPDSIFGQLSNRKVERSKGVERIIPIQRVTATATTTHLPSKSITLTKTSNRLIDNASNRSIDSASNRSSRTGDVGKTWPHEKAQLLSDISNVHKLSAKVDKWVADEAPHSNKKSVNRNEKSSDGLSVPSTAKKAPKCFDDMSRCCSYETPFRPKNFRKQFYLGISVMI
jgi:hypothetical protein